MSLSHNEKSYNYIVKYSSQFVRSSAFTSYRRVHKFFCISCYQDIYRELFSVHIVWLEVHPDIQAYLVLLKVLGIYHIATNNFSLLIGVLNILLCFIQMNITISSMLLVSISPIHLRLRLQILPMR